MAKRTARVNPQVLAGDFIVSQRTVMVGTTPTLIAPGDPNRVCLMLSNPSANNVFYGIDPTITTLSGHVLLPNQIPIWFVYRDFGEMIGFQWWGRSTINNNTTVVTVSYKPIK